MNTKFRIFKDSNKYHVGLLSDDLSTWDVFFAFSNTSLEELKNTIASIQAAFDLPVLSFYDGEPVSGPGGLAK